MPKGKAGRHKRLTISAVQAVQDDDPHSSRERESKREMEGVTHSNQSDKSRKDAHHNDENKKVYRKEIDTTTSKFTSYKTKCEHTIVQWKKRKSEISK